MDNGILLQIENRGFIKLSSKKFERLSWRANNSACGQSRSNKTLEKYNSKDSDRKFVVSVKHSKGIITGKWKFFDFYWIALKLLQKIVETCQKFKKKKTMFTNAMMEKFYTTSSG